MEQHYWDDYENPKCSELAILEDCVKETHPSCIDLFQRQADIHYGPVLQYPEYECVKAFLPKMQEKFSIFNKLVDELVLIQKLLKRQ